MKELKINFSTCASSATVSANATASNRRRGGARGGVPIATGTMRRDVHASHGGPRVHNAHVTVSERRRGASLATATATATASCRASGTHICVDHGTTTATASAAADPVSRPWGAAESHHCRRGAAESRHCRRSPAPAPRGGEIPRRATQISASGSRASCGRGRHN